MQYDMHYYGTYAMASAAGIPASDAMVIATAAQFVDDHNTHDWVMAGNHSGEGVRGIATAHHPLDSGVRAVVNHVDVDDSRFVWVPFHFLPGNEGTSFEERMLAVKDSAIANEMLDFYLQPATLQAHREHALELMGIAAHVYADTFSHYGFSGLPSDLNLVDTGTLDIDEGHSESIKDYIKQRMDGFLANWGGLPRLGHGAVLTHPDRPYLRWSFRYQDGRPSMRDNQLTFLEGCRKLHARFAQFAQLYYGAAWKGATPWQKIEDEVAAILATEAAADDRVEAWLDAMHREHLGPQVQPCLSYEVDTWNAQVERYRAGSDTAAFARSNAYRFFAAADYHRNYVLKRLLPRAGLLVA